MMGFGNLTKNVAPIIVSFGLFNVVRKKSNVDLVNQVQLISKTMCFWGPYAVSLAPN